MIATLTAAQLAVAMLAMPCVEVQYLSLERGKGVAPELMLGRNSESGLTRPLCPYPKAARYDGSGDLKDAANWSCAAP